MRKWSWLLLLVLTAAAYGGALWNGFVWDDDALIVRNPDMELQGTGLLSFFGRDFFQTGSASASYRAGGYYRPLVLLSFVADRRLWGFKPAGFHLTNLIIHFANGLLVLVIARRLVGEERAALGAAAFFLIHPVQASAAVYISGRTDLLAALGCLGAVALLVYNYPAAAGRVNGMGLRKQAAASAGAAVLAAAALGSKEMAVCLPVIFLVYVMVFPGARKGRGQRVLLWAGPQAAVLVGYFAVRASVLEFMGGDIFRYFEGSGLRVLATARAVVTYLRLVVVPVGLRVERFLPVAGTPWKASYLAAAAALVCLIVLAAAGARRSRTAAFGGLWFFAALLPVANVVPIYAARTDVVFAAEQFLYLPLAGLLIAAAEGARRLRARAGPCGACRAGRALAGAAVIVFCGLSAARTADWRDEITFGEKAVESGARSARILVNLGRAYASEGRTAEREGRMAEAKRRMAGAEEQFRAAIASEPGSASPHFQFGVFLGSAGRTEEAIWYYGQALAINPRHVDALINMGVDLARAGRSGEAISALKRAVDLDPGSAPAHYNLGLLYAGAAMNEGALAEWERVLAMEPGHEKARSRAEALTRGEGGR